jgi:arginyl-tRNA synthetase
MPNGYPSIREHVSQKLRERLLDRPEFRTIPLPEELIERPRDPAHGDYATAVAMELARRLRKPPREIGETIAGCFTADPDFAEVTVAGPGFVNFRLSADLWRRALRDSIARGPGFGDWRLGGGRRVVVEYVSANPTGPLNVVNARAAAVGSTLVRLLTKIGFAAVGEFYVNDTGRQAQLLGESLAVHFRRLHGEPDLELPEGGYPGDYLTDIARRIPEGEGRRLVSDGARGVRRFAEVALDAILPMQRASLERYGVTFERWFRESSLHDAPAGGTSAVLSALRELTAQGAVVEREGAKWFQASALGAEKDNVLVRSEGAPTYLLGDIAYHLDKVSRGYDHAIDIWGPDHHGAIERLQRALGVLGHDGFLEVLIVQQVNLLRDGKPVKISKRGGEFITLDELLDEVGVDAAKFFFLLRRCDSHLDFDLDLARLASAENPVYYVQYAHARICSILRYAGREDGLGEDAAREAPLDRLDHPFEFDLVKCIVDFPEVVRSAALGRDVQKLPHYLRDVAQTFHRFYDQCRVVTDDAGLTRARLVLVEGARRALASTLALMGVGAPQRM